jgi:hypothetical protein
MQTISSSSAGKKHQVSTTACLLMKLVRWLEQRSFLTSAIQELGTTGKYGEFAALLTDTLKELR